MIGGRSFIIAARNGCGFSLKRHNLLKSSLVSNARPFCSIKGTWGTPDQQTPKAPPLGEMKFINRRFLHNNYRDTSNTRKWSVASRLVAAALGAIIGLGGKAISERNDGVWKGYYHAACEKCGCGDEEPCVEKKCEDAPCLREMDCQEELIIKANSELEKALKEIKSKAIEYTEAAMKAYCAAIEIMKEYMNQGYCLIDADDLEPPEYEESWCCLYKIAKDRCEKVKDALQKGQCAWELLCRLREVIESGKACQYTACNPLLVTAEESLICAERELLNLKARMDCVSSDHEMVEQYQQVIEDFKTELRKEVDAIIASGECKICFAEQETALMIIQAYKKAVRTQKDVAQVMICTGDIPERLQETVC